MKQGGLLGYATLTQPTKLTQGRRRIGEKLLIRHGDEEVVPLEQVMKRYDLEG